MNRLSNPEKESLCKHCGSKVPGNLGDFCCSGCQSVYHILHESGLEHFYDLKSIEDFSFFQPADIKNNNYEFFNDQTFLNENISQLANGFKVQFFLSGVQCSACVWLVGKLPEICEGVKRADFNFGTSVVDIIYDPELVSLQKVAQVLNSLGYSPEPYHPSVEDEYRRKTNNLLLIQMGVAAFCAGNTMMIAISLYQGLFSGIADQYRTFLEWVSFFITIPAVFFSAQAFYKAAFSSLKIKRIHIDFPISLGILTGFVFSFINMLIGSGEVYYDSICMLIFLLLAGRYLQKIGVDKAYKAASLENLMLPGFARVFDGSEYKEQYIRSVVAGKRIKVLSGEKIPVDGKVVQGNSSVSNAFLTGESEPISVCPGSVIFAGSTNLGEEIILESKSDFYGFRINKIISLIKNSTQTGSSVNSDVNKLSVWFVVIVLLLAVFTFLYWSFASGLEEAVLNSMSLLIVTCPCALGLAAPLIIARAVGQLALKNIYIRSAAFFDNLFHTKSFYFDKTGTLTRGNFVILKEEDYYDQTDPSLLLCRIAALEKMIQHPIRQAFISRANADFDLKIIHKENHPGMGLVGEFADGSKLAVGSVKLMNKLSIDLPDYVSSRISNYEKSHLTLVLVALNSNLIASFGLGDSLREGMKSLIEELKTEGKSAYILSGDNISVVSSIANELKIGKVFYFSDLSPEEKTKIIQQDKSFNCMIGDGANDAPALKQANLSIGVGGSSEVNLLVADCFMREFSAQQLKFAIQSSSKVRAAIRTNIVFSLSYNIIGAGLAMSGYISPLIAAILMPISSFTVILMALKFNLLKKPWV